MMILIYVGLHLMLAAYEAVMLRKLRAGFRLSVLVYGLIVVSLAVGIVWIYRPNWLSPNRAILQVFGPLQGLVQKK